MKNYNSLKTLVLSLSMLVSMNASANLIFNFEEKKANFHEVEYSLSDYTLTTKAFNSDGTDADVARWTNGLGVRHIDSPNLEIGEWLTFELDTTFYGIFEIDFSGFGNHDTAGITINVASVEDVFDTTGNNDTWISGYVALDSFRVLGLTGDSAGNGFRISELRLVTEPGALAILALGLMALGVIRRRRVQA